MDPDRDVWLEGVGLGSSASVDECFWRRGGGGGGGGTPSTCWRLGCSSFVSLGGCSMDRTGDRVCGLGKCPLLQAGH
jgi:hypothetical protein